MVNNFFILVKSWYTLFKSNIKRDILEFTAL